MAHPPAVKAQLLTLVRTIPIGRVATIDLIANQAGMLPTLVTTLLASLSDDERQITPWHRVVAKGGALGRGSHRDAQFAGLVREGVQVSPAGIVQDMTRVAVANFDAAKPGAAVAETSTVAAVVPQSRSRGMKDRPA